MIVGVGPCTLVVIVTELFSSLDSRASLFGSIVAVLLTTGSTAVMIEPVMVMVATALGPVPSEPMSQSSVPPMTLSRSEQTPRVVLKPV